MIIDMKLREDAPNLTPIKMVIRRKEDNVHNYIIKKIAAKITDVTILDNADVKDKRHWVGRVGVIDTVDIGKCLSFEFDGEFCRTPKVYRILIQENTIAVEAGSYRFTFERM